MPWEKQSINSYQMKSFKRFLVRRDFENTSTKHAKCIHAVHLTGDKYGALCIHIIDIN